MDEREDQRPLLVVGIPRSGTTWTARVLGASAGRRVVMEPDNEKISAPAIRAKRGLGRFPVLEPRQPAPEYRRLWEWALSGTTNLGQDRTARLANRLLARAGTAELEAMLGGKGSIRTRLAETLGERSAGARHDGSLRRTVAKSVHAPLAVEWLANEFSLEVLVVHRHPANVLASWLELDLPDADRRLDDDPSVRARFSGRWGLDVPGQSRVERAAWQIGLLSSALEEAAGRHPEWHVRTHEALCSDPVAEFGHLYEETGLEWGEQVERLIAEGERPGSGFSLQRRPSELPEAWRSRLDGCQVSTLRRVLEGFPMRDWWAAGSPARS